MPPRSRNRAGAASRVSKFIMRLRKGKDCLEPSGFVKKSARLSAVATIRRRARRSASSRRTRERRSGVAPHASCASDDRGCTRRRWPTGCPRAGASDPRRRSPSCRA
eukprot:6512-Prymnesium_polylepis.2